MERPVDYVDDVMFSLSTSQICTDQVPVFQALVTLVTHLIDVGLRRAQLISQHVLCGESESKDGKVMNLSLHKM
jgi:hypothetical protein